MAVGAPARVHHLLAVEEQLALILAFELSKHSRKGRLTRPGFPDQGGDLAGVQLDRNVNQGTQQFLV